MKIEMVTREMENMMSDYIVAIFPKNDYREGVFYEAVEVMYQFTEDICECEWLVVPFTSYGLYEEFNNTIGRYMSSPMTFMCQTNELRILL